MPHQGDGFVEAVLAVVTDIPPGKVMTYGDVAAAIGSRAARGVGQVMAYYGNEVPWWRVIRASGHPAQGHEAEAVRLLEAEGTPLVRTADGGAKVRLPEARHSPGVSAPDSS